MLEVNQKIFVEKMSLDDLQTINSLLSKYK